MANSLITQDWNNPTTPAPRMGDGTAINYTTQPGNPGLKPILDQYDQSFKDLYNNLDATVPGKGLQYENLANGAVQAVNMREIINTSVNNRLFSIVNPTNGGYLTQTDGQAVNKFILIPPFQAITNFRNFQAGVDNVTTELDISLDIGYLVSSGLNTALGWIGNWYAQPDGLAAAADYRNIKIVTEVDSNSAFTSAVIVSKKSFYGYTNYTSQENNSPWSIKAIDKTTKNYQNPWYRTYLIMEKAPNQAAGVAMNLIMQGLASATYKCKNKHL